MMNKKWVLILTLTVGLALAAGTSSQAAPEDFYQKLLTKKWGLAVETLPQEAVAIKFDQEAVKGESLNSQGEVLPAEYRSPVSFKLTGEVDYLTLRLSMEGDFLPGKLTLSQRTASGYQVVTSFDYLIPVSYFSRRLGAGDFRLSVESSEISVNRLDVSIQAFRYLPLTDKTNSNFYRVLLLSSIPQDQDFFDPLFKRLPIIFICDQEEPRVLLGVTCDGEAVVGGPLDISIISDPQGHSLALVPRAAQRSVLISGKILTDDSKIESLRRYLLTASPFIYRSSQNIVVGKLVEFILGFYELAKDQVWVGYLLVSLFFLLLLVWVLPRIRRVSGLLTDLNSLKNSLAIWGIKFRRLKILFLIFTLISLVFFLLVLSSNTLIRLFDLIGPIYDLRLLLKTGLATMAGFDNLRSVLRSIWLYSFFVILLIFFLDKVVAFLAPSLKKTVVRRLNDGGLERLLLASLALFLLLRLASIFQLWRAIFALIVVLALVVWEFRSSLVKQEKLSISQWSSRRKWGLLVFLFLIWCLGSVFTWWQSTQPVAVFKTKEVVQLGEERKLAGIFLPQLSQVSSAVRGYQSVEVLPNLALYADNFLVAYPQASVIKYLKSSGRGSADGFRGEKVAIDGVAHNGGPASLEDYLKFLGSFLEESSTSSLLRPTRLGFLNGYRSPVSEYLFYAFLSEGLGQVDLTFTDVGLSPRRGGFSFRVFNHNGDIVDVADQKMNGDYRLNRPKIKKISQAINVPSTGIYAIVIDYEPSASDWLPVSNRIFLNESSLNGPTYFVDPRVFRSTAALTDQDLRLTSNQPFWNPFVFELKSFGDGADAALFFNDFLETEIRPDSGKWQLASTLNRLLQADRTRKRFWLNYFGQPGLLVLEASSK